MFCVSVILMTIKDIRSNPLLLCDAYNLAHGDMKVSTDWEVSHLYNRKSGQILYGFHEAISTFLAHIKVTPHMVDDAVSVSNRFGLEFPKTLFEKLIRENDGKIPLQVQTLPEGTYCPAGTPFAQISNTIEGYGELVTWWEGIFLQTYFSSACATEAKNIRDYLKTTGDEDGLRAHSFGFRGHKSLEDAYYAGSAWALFLPSSDDLHIGLHHSDCGLNSIPALAHKVVSQFDNEYDAFVRAIDVAANAALKTVSLVIDTYDAYNFIKRYLMPLASYANDKNVTIVLRPDSGDTWKQVVDIYDIVNENNLVDVKTIIGEGMSLTEIKKADVFFKKNNVPLKFVSYGIGAGFYKHLERDSLGYAMKTAFSNGKPRMKFSENPMKRSIPGRIAIYREKTTQELCVGHDDIVPQSENLLIDIYNDGDWTQHPPLSEIRVKAQSAESTQIYIKTSMEIKRMVQEFRNRYKK